MTTGRAGRGTHRKVGFQTLRLFAAFLCVIPFAWMILTAFKDPSDALRFTWLPENPSFDAFFELFDVAPMATYLTNSFKITFLVVIGRLAVCSLAGYALARLEFPGKKWVFGFLVGVMLLPVLLAIIPLYVAYQRVGWLDTHWPLIIPPMVSNSFGVIWMRQFFLSVPNDLEHAAQVDGAGPFRIYWRIMLPLSTGHLAALGIFTAIASWNEFFTAVIFLNSRDQFTVPVGLAFFADSVGSDIPVLMAGTLVSILPLLIVYLIAQRQIIDRMIESGIR